MPTVTNLQNRTHKVIDKFIGDINSLTFTNDFGRSTLLRRTKTFFDAMDALGEEEFAKIFIDYNFSSFDTGQYEKYQAALHCLVALVVANYSSSDLSRYFFSEDSSKKENKPEYASNSWRISHWFRLIGYWFRQLRNRQKYEITPENRPLSESLEYVKDSLKKESYNTLMNTDGNFNTCLRDIINEIEKKAIRPKLNEMSRANFSSDQAYRQRLMNVEKEQETREKTLLEKNELLTKKENELLVKEENVLQREENLEQLEQKEEHLARREESYREKEQLIRDIEVIAQKKEKDFQAEIKELKEQVSTLRAKHFEATKNITSLEEDNYKLAKKLESHNFQAKNQSDLAKPDDLTKKVSENPQPETYTENTESKVNDSTYLPASSTLTQEQAPDILPQNNKAAKTAIGITKNFFDETFKENEALKENEHPQAATNLYDLVAIFKEEFLKFQESQQIQRQQSEENTENYASDTDSNCWDTDWESDSDEIDGTATVYSIQPSQKAELMKTLEKNMSDLKIISKEAIFEIMKASLSEVTSKVEEAQRDASSLPASLSATDDRKQSLANDKVLSKSQRWPLSLSGLLSLGNLFSTKKPDETVVTNSDQNSPQKSL